MFKFSTPQNFVAQIFQDEVHQAVLQSQVDDIMLPQTHIPQKYTCIRH